MVQDTTWYTNIGLGPADIVLDGYPAPHPRNGGHSSPHFWVNCSGSHLRWPTF